MASTDGEIVVRRAGPADRMAMIQLCRTALGWGPDDPNERFFSWKHDENPFGSSPAWLAVEPDGRLAGVRVFLQWRFRRGPQVLRAVRAVDTATRPDAQGRGIFRRLTTGALPDLAGSGVEAVFNTPNDQSRPGYLKMGWKVVGEVPVRFRLRGPRSLLRVAGARTAADKWSLPCDVGLPAAQLLDDADAIERLLASLPAPQGAHTDRSAEYLRWRFSFDALRYRAVPLGDRIEDGLVVFRLRRRGPAIEAAICEILEPPGGRAGRAMAWILRRSGADYAIRCDPALVPSGGFLPAPGLGPVLTWRPLGNSAAPELADLALSLADVELF